MKGRARKLAGARVPVSRGVRVAIGSALGAVVIALAACSSTPASVPASTTSTTKATPQSSTTSTTTATTANCSTSQLQISAGTSSGAAGTIGQVILFKNTSTSTCVLHAFPGVAGLDNAGNQIAQATRVVNLAPFSGSTSSLPTVSLAPGMTASALVFGSDVPTGTATSCVTYAALLVTPPNAFQSVRVAATLPGCAGLRVGPVFAGTTGAAS